tara:strand:+ start:220 stop:525 length:306 start_codon:yes stop_codon:yes gene_type:complete
MRRNKGAGFEREVARALSTERTGTRGKPDDEHGDVLHPDLFIQCKRRAKIGIYAWWEENKQTAEPTGKEPILIVRQDRSEPLVVMSMEMFNAFLEAADLED